jgi:hypothetical protein
MTFGKVFLRLIFYGLNIFGDKVKATENKKFLILAVFLDHRK